MQNAMDGNVKFSNVALEKIILILKEALIKIKTVEHMSTLHLKEDGKQFNEGLSNAKLQYKKLQKGVANYLLNVERSNRDKDFFFSESDAFLKLADKMAFYVNEWSSLDWEALRPAASEPSQAVAEFYSQFENMISIIINMMTRTAKEWNTEKRFVERSSNFLKKNDQMIAKLEKELSETGIPMDQAHAKLKKIAEISHQITLLSNLEKGEMNVIRKKRDARTEMIDAKHKEGMQILKTKEAALKESVADVKLVSERTHESAEERIRDLKMCIIWIIDKYDERMAKYQKEFDKLWKVFSTEMERCRGLCIYYNDIKDKAERLYDEKRRKIEAELRERIRTRIRNKAATKIQRFWRRVLAKRAERYTRKEKTKEKKEKKKKKK